MSFPYDLDSKQVQLGARLRKALCYALESPSISSRLRPGLGLSILEARRLRFALALALSLRLFLRSSVVAW